MIRWDYGDVADAYTERAPYCDEALSSFLRAAKIRPPARVCDVGAGTGNLTLPLLRRGLTIVALEPDARMGRVGRKRTAPWSSVVWRARRAEETGEASSSFDLVSFGSSFNVVDRDPALAEALRILRPGGWLLCIWNHRRLEERLQADIEAVIRSFLPDFAYGTRREDQTSVLASRSELESPIKIESPFEWRGEPQRWLRAWDSHLTLRRQAAQCYPAIRTAIETLLACEGPVLTVPYVTRLWAARKRLNPHSKESASDGEAAPLPGPGRR